MGGSIRKVTGLVDFKPETAAVQPETTAVQSSEHLTLIIVILLTVEPSQ
jgi:hypothetical protein